MKSPIILLLVFVSFTLSCSRTGSFEAAVPAARDNGVVAQKHTDTAPAQPLKFSLSEAAEAEAAAAAADRKIIRNAEITMEVASTIEAQHRVSSIAEAYGGFVVTSEAKQRDNADPVQRTLDIKLVVRVPASKFGVTLDEIKKLASNLPEEKTTGQDVTEEFIDLEARIKTQKALELQFLEIMRQASKVADALEVQRQLADVRTEIEKLEGRKRFLENRSTLATITVNIQAPKPVIATTPTGFRHSLGEAISESVEVASGMVVFFIQFLIVMAPVFLFIILPAGLILRYLTRRAKRMRLAQELATPAPQ